MALDLTGIQNENDFYSHHYLTAILEGDLKEIFKAWNEQEASYREAIRERGEKPDTTHPDRAPWIRLRALGQDYFRMRNHLERERSNERRVELQRVFFADLLKALGYDYRPEMRALDRQGEIPVLCEIAQGAQPRLWVLGALDASREGDDPLTLNLHRDQFSKAWREENEPGKTLLNADFDALISKQVFALEQPPRWLLLLSDAQLLLIDRSKWNEKRLLRFDLTEIFSRKEETTFKAMAALLARDHIVPKDGLCLIDSLDENAHKHAFAVSEDLKYALRQSIELLGNEAVRHLREISKEKLYTDAMADQLSRECLRYMYRLLFLFYIESRPELGYAPHHSEAWRKGYSLESLRELELVPLHTEEAQNGSYIRDSIQLLFDLIHKGFQPDRQKHILAGGDAEAFGIEPLNSHLFDPAYTRILNKVRFRNEVLQKIIRLMSLTRPGKGRNRRRGRISYAQLGINQLGAVYEALLSYRGFFAPHDLFEVKKAGEAPDELEAAWFVSEAELENYSEGERVLDENRGFKRYPQGTFIYRMSGRDRQKSASYYTPEVLTRSLVKQALKELLKNKSADDILKLKICEPAMGSAAFLNEAIDQLAETYLRLKQKETGKRIAHEKYAAERQKVKMLLADNNVFGVDLNPIAQELAEVSLWLNAIHEGGFVPWFGLQLFNGNSLVGARRQVYHPDLLEKSCTKDQLWHSQAPSRLAPSTLGNDCANKFAPTNVGSNLSDQTTKVGSNLSDQTMLQARGNRIYHFLLPDPGMARYQDKVIKNLAAEPIEAMGKWRTAFCKPYTETEIHQLQQFSEKIDHLWQAHARQQAEIRNRTTDPLTVWGQPTDQTHKTTRLEFKDRVLAQERYSENLKNSSAYRRLKLVMDYWCALWFWPIDKHALLPDRSQYFMDLHWLLMGNVMEVIREPGEIGELFPDTLPQQQAMDFNNRFGQLDIDKLLRENPRLKLADKLAGQQRSFHWELEFADIFAASGGFDLLLGNPPWIKVEWQEAGVMGDANPLFALRKFSAKEMADLREESFEKYPTLKNDYFAEFEAADATQNFLNAAQNYPLLKGVQTNLYKCFLPQAWMVGSAGSVAGFLHPEGIYDDPKGGLFRAALYPRLRGHFQFQNELNLFAEVDHHAKFSINLYATLRSHAPRGNADPDAPRRDTERSAFKSHSHAARGNERRVARGNKDVQSPVKFGQIANLYAPATIAACYEHDGRGDVPGIKNDAGKWNTRGHAERIIQVDEDALATFARLYDEPGTPPLQARLPALHTRQLLSVLEKFARQSRRLGDLKGEYYSTVMFDETYAQRDGTIRRETRFPEDAGHWVLSGPHFFVGIPFYKTPRAQCTQNSHYDMLDLTDLPDDYLPRSNYLPDCDEAEYRRRTPRVPWVSDVAGEDGVNRRDAEDTEEENGGKGKVTEYYRFFARRGLGPSAERTLIPSIVPKGVAHIHGVNSTTFKSIDELLTYSGLCYSVVFDFFVKTTGKSDLYESLLRLLPLPSATSASLRLIQNLRLRALALNCLTTHYADLWC